MSRSKRWNAAAAIAFVLSTTVASPSFAQGSTQNGPRDGADSSRTSKPEAAAPTALFAPVTASGTLQVQLTGGDSSLRSTYRIRRAEIKVISDLGNRAQAVLMMDLAKTLAVNSSGTEASVAQSSRALQDAYLVVPVHGVQLDAGQQRLPLGYEGMQPSSVLETVDRALFQSDRARGGGLGDVRDLGVAASGSLRRVDYKVGVFNGSGESMNDVDRNVAKALVGQVALRPSFLRGLRLGVSGATSGAATDDKPARDRLGLDVVLTRRLASIQAELMTGRDGSIARRGFYALGTISPRSGVKFVARFDTWDPDIHSEATAGDVTERDLLAGITWLPTATRLKLHVAVVRKTYSNDITPATTQLLSQLQAAW
jgi:hypothetical protein